MPELPEVETVVRSLQGQLLGARVGAVVHSSEIIARANCRGWKTALRGRVIKRFERQGKYIVVHLSGGHALVIHLRMTGHLWIKSASHRVGPHDRFVLSLSGHRRLVLVDLRQFARVEWRPLGTLNRHAGLAKLGPDALAISPTQLRGICKPSRRPIKSLLLDQTKVAGLGNIYTDESLFAAGIRPQTPAKSIGPKRILRLHESILTVLANAIEACGTTFDTFSDPAGVAGAYGPRLTVYRRTGQPCRVCGTAIQRVVIAGRGTHFCRRCQKS